MAASEGLIVWEWFSDHGRWRPYSPVVTKAIEDKYGKEPVFPLSQVDDNLAAYEIHYGTMQQINSESGNGRTIRRNIVSKDSPAAKGIEWQWLDNSGWIEYDLAASQFIEEAYLAKKTNVDLSATKCHLPYVIDFSTMVQTKHYTGFKRSVRRILLQERYPQIGSVQEPSSSSCNETNVSDNVSRTGVSSGVAAETSEGTKGTAATSKVVTSNDGCSSTANPSAGMLPHSEEAEVAVPQSKSGRRLSGKRPTGRKSVATKADKKASVAWTNVEAKRYTKGQEKQKELMARTVSVPTDLSTDFPSSSTNSMVTPCPPLTHSATTSQIDSMVSRKTDGGKMVRSHSTPSQITAKAAYKAGPRLSPVMTAMTGLLISTAIPVTLTPTHFSIYNTPSSRTGTRPVQGVPPPNKRRKKMAKVQASPSEVVEKYVKVLDTPPDEDCSICFGKLSSSSYYHEPEEGDDKGDPVMSLDRCGHCFHKSCLMAMYESGPRDGSIQCPSCKTIYGIKLGNQPRGFMDYHVLQRSLPAFPEHETIRIIYNIPPGIQGPEHPNPGMPYTTRGFPRSCYLPDNEIGRRILRLLIVAWERRLIFTVGTSATTGETNTVIWNEIHHKTEFSSNRTGHGYPDPHYFDNVLAELAAHGVTEDQTESPEG